MELNDIQKEAVAKWAEEGLNLSEIQKNLQSEFGINMTYMDVRFLVLDIGCAIKDKEKPAEPEQDSTPQDMPADAEPPSAPPLSDDPDAVGSVTVELDRVVKAGAVVSGTVVFSDGVKATWAVDNMGRMVLDPGDNNEGYRPSEEDIRAFQVELKNEVTKRGL